VDTKTVPVRSDLAELALKATGAQATCGIQSLRSTERFQIGFQLREIETLQCLASGS
jgi:hypothetical protein